MTRLTCSCCGLFFSDTVENTKINDCDVGYGICDPCADWTSKRNKEICTDYIQEFAANLSEKNRAVYLGYDYELQLAIFNKAIADGVVGFRIGKGSAK